MKPQIWLESVIELAIKAGRNIMDYYGQSSASLDVSKKDDNTLLTAADLSAHNIIHDGLSELTPQLPQISEEGNIPPLSERSQWPYYWLIDPLDGTRGFVERLNEFTVNIALIKNHQPILGVVYDPVNEACYYATSGQGAYKLTLNNGQHQPIMTGAWNKNHFRLLLGHFLSSNAALASFNQMPNCEVIRLNSSLKFCWIAENRGDVYPRFGRTSEWDTAAAQCVLSEAGGGVYNFQTDPLTYNKHETVINPAFIAVGDKQHIQEIIQLIESTRRTK